jgi:hypothetical protein
MVEALDGIEIEQEPAIDDAGEAVADRIDAATFWQDIQAELNGEEERVLVSLIYVHGLKPGEVCAGYARLFPSVEDVYRVKRNLLARLRRNHHLRANYGR